MARLLLVAITALLSSQAAWAQSTSQWLAITDNTKQAPGPREVPAARIGGSYLTAEYVNGQIYQNSNWWTNMTQSNPTAVLTVSVTGELDGVKFSDTRTAGTLEIKKNDAQTEFGWVHQKIVETVPTTFKGLQITVKISKAAKDGLSDLLTKLVEMTKDIPPLSVAQASLGIASGAKQIADYLFAQKLLEKKLESQFQCSNDDDSLKTGYYVVFAGDSKSDYVNYFTPGPSGKGLSWDGSDLSWDGRPVGKVSYFIIRLRHTNLLYASPKDALSFTSKPWVVLYKAAQEQAGQLSNLSQLDDTVQKVRASVNSAETLVDKDSELIESEKDSIKNTLRETLEKKLNERLERLRGVTHGGTVPLSGPGGRTTTVPIKILLGEPDRGKKTHPL